MRDDGLLDVEGTSGWRLVDEAAVGYAGGEGDFECALNADAIGGVDGAVVVGVEVAEHGAEAFDPFGLELLLQFEPQCWIGVGQYGDAVAESLDVETAATYGNEGVVGLEEAGDEGDGFLLIGEDVERVGD